MLTTTGLAAGRDGPRGAGADRATSCARSSRPPASSGGGSCATPRTASRSAARPWPASPPWSTRGSPTRRRSRRGAVGCLARPDARRDRREPDAARPDAGPARAAGPHRADATGRRPRPPSGSGVPARDRHRHRRGRRDGRHGLAGDRPAGRPRRVGDERRSRRRPRRRRGCWASMPRSGRSSPASWPTSCSSTAIRWPTWPCSGDRWPSGGVGRSVSA